MTKGLLEAVLDVMAYDGSGLYIKIRDNAVRYGRA